MTDTIDFEPDAKRAVALDRRMRERLGASLRYIAEEVAGRVPLDREALDSFFARLSEGPVSALLFGAYCDLVLAIDAGETDRSAALLAEIAAAQNRPAGPVVSDLADPEFDLASARYIRLIDTDPLVSFTVAPPPPDIANVCRERIAAAFALLEAGDPAVAAEIRAMIGEIVLTVGSDEPAELLFDGASSFMLWGAIILNASVHQTALEMAQALVHESGHNLLFGLCADGPLIENDDDPRYRSPLRADLRPMDGIVHATYVTARMHRSARRLLQAGVLDDAAAAYARASLIAQRRGFDEGMMVIHRDALLTPRGRAIMTGASDYMAASA